MDPSSSRRRPRPSDTYKDVAFFLINTSRGEGQCVIAKDTRGRLVLITNHHVLPSREGVEKCSLVFGTKNLKLKWKHLYSCCGPDSAWPVTSIHVPKPEKEEAGCCPWKEDWTVVILDKDFEREIEHANTRRVTFPRLCVCDRGAVNTDVSVFERQKNGEPKLHPVAIQPPAVPENREACIKHDIQDYVSRSRLRYRYRSLLDIGPGCSGAPIFAEHMAADGTNTLSLLGIHCTSPGADSSAGADSSDAYFTGLSIDFIMSSLYICGGLEIGCSLVPTLSFLKDMIQKTNALPPAVVLDRVSHSIECHKNDQCVQLVRLQSISTSAEWQEEKRKVLLCNLGILEFVMTEINKIVLESFDLASSPDGLPVMKLLTALFSLFDGFERSGICAVVRSSENKWATLESRICQLCKKLLVVLRNNRQATQLVKAIFAMISPLLNFSYDNGPACCLLETPNIQMFGTISQSAAAKTDVSTLEACYTAFIKSLEFAHQDDMARAWLEREQSLEQQQDYVQPSATPCALSRADIFCVGGQTFTVDCQLMDSVIDSDMFLDLCSGLTIASSRWNFIGKLLKVNDKTIARIQEDKIHYIYTTDQFLELLIQWKLEKGNGATYRELIRALNREDFADAMKIVLEFLCKEHD